MRSSTSSAAGTWRRGIPRTPKRCTRRGRCPRRGRNACRTRSSRSNGRRCAAFPQGRSAARSPSSTTRAWLRVSGSPGSAPPLLAQHDWVHVLAGYGSTVESELEVFAFIARANDDPRAFSLLAMVISLFETGYLASGARVVPVRPRPSVPRGHGGTVGRRDAPRCALRRPRRWARLAEPRLVRRRRSLGRRRTRRSSASSRSRRHAVAAGSVSAWEPGGISPYQYECGKRAAEAAGRRYESFGATPE